MSDTHSGSTVEHTPAGSRERIVKVAKKQLGYAEKPVNKVKYFEWAGDTTRGPGPWCSVFATWVWHAAGVDLAGQPYPLQSAVASVRDTARNDGRLKSSNPLPGDAVLYGRDGGGSQSHIGIVEKISGNTLYVIEGNAGLLNQSDKYVIRRKINLKKINNSSYAAKHIPWAHIYGYVEPPSRR
jgi:hypothetical protein